MVDELFLSINLVLTALKLFKIGNLTLFFLNLLAAYRNSGSNYFPHIETCKVINFHVSYAKSKLKRKKV